MYFCEEVLWAVPSLDAKKKRGNDRTAFFDLFSHFNTLHAPSEGNVEKFLSSYVLQQQYIVSE